MSFLSFKNIIYCLGIGVVSNIFQLTPVVAQNFTVSPMVTITEAKGGQSKASITIRNKGKELLRMRVYAEDFTYERKKGFVTTGNHDRSAVPYVQFSPRELAIPPGITRSIRVSTLLPPSIPDREYRAVIFVEDLKERNLKENNGNAIVIKARVASVFYTSKGEARSDLQIGEVVLNNNKLSIVLTNKGKQSGYPDVNWRIDKDGKEIAKDILRGILVQSEKEREVELKSKGQPLPLSSGTYNLSGEILSPSQKSSPFSLKVTIP
jgi:P pilus assembly chaperone PapD